MKQPSFLPRAHLAWIPGADGLASTNRILLTTPTKPPRIGAHVFAISGNDGVRRSTHRQRRGGFNECTRFFSDHPMSFSLCGFPASTEHHEPQADDGLRLNRQHRRV